MMKKFTILALVMLMAMSAKAATEIYAAISGTTMTIYYDNQRTSRNGKPAPTAANTGWLTFTELSTYINTVVFDASLKNATITSTAYWFDGMLMLNSFQNTANLDTRNVTNMERMFRGCERLASWPFSYMYFVTSNVENMHGMFNNCKKLTSLDWSSYGAASLKKIDAMFLNCSALTSVKFSSTFRTDQVTDMDQMFQNCTSLTSVDLSMFEVGSVTNFNKMFYDCAALKTIKADYDWKAAAPSNATSDDMFNGCENLKGENGTTYSASHVDIVYARPDAAGEKGYFTKSACPKPRELKATKKTATTMTITWKAESKHMRFTVWYCKEGQEGYNTMEVTTNTAVLTDLKPSTLYEIFVEADCSSSKTSDKSATLKESTLEAGQGVENAQWNGENSTKIIRNGQLYIMIGDKTYDVLGNEIK